ncbi:MAG: hypothetical protein ABSG46_01865 [Candidatus Binataceae bacterium]|jgi:hypothetical protein
MKRDRLLLSGGFVASFALLPGVALAGHTSGTVKGSLLSQSSGPCDVGYSSFCPSGNCVCDIFVGTISGNPVGKGTAELWATVDNGAAVSSGLTCFPVFGALGISTSRDTEVINATGSACNNAGGTVDTLSGGFGISQSAVGANAWGSLTGTFDLSTGAGVVKYSGTTF